MSFYVGYLVSGSRVCGSGGEGRGGDGNGFKDNGVGSSGLSGGISGINGSYSYCEILVSWLLDGGDIVAILLLSLTPRVVLEVALIV